jgi:hypothetical protein
MENSKQDAIQGLLDVANRNKGKATREQSVNALVKLANPTYRPQQSSGNALIDIARRNGR